MNGPHVARFAGVGRDDGFASGCAQADLIRAGVSSFKIEGRLKTPEYVAAVTQVYRRALDRALADGANYAVPATDRYTLEMTFSRGLFSGWLHGVDHRSLVHARFGTKRGPFAGIIARVGADFAEFETEVDLKPGDGVVFDTGANPDDEQGGRIFEVRGNRYFFQRGKIDFRRIAAGDRVWKTSDPALERELRKTFEGGVAAAARPAALTVAGAVGSPLRVKARCESASVEVFSDSLLQPRVPMLWIRMSCASSSAGSAAADSSLRISPTNSMAISSCRCGS
ncbi:MAG: peptidase U32 family protein [Opitutaceae bacterium]